MLQVGKSTKDAIVFGRRSYNVMILQLSLPEEAVDGRVNRHRAVASPSDLRGISEAKEICKALSNIGDDAVCSLAAIIRSTRSRDTELSLKFDAGLKNTWRFRPTRRSVIQVDFALGHDKLWEDITQKIADRLAVNISRRLAIKTSSELSVGALAKAHNRNISGVGWRVDRCRWHCSRGSISKG
jgi:hypothetical protein